MNKARTIHDALNLPLPVLYYLLDKSKDFASPFPCFSIDAVIALAKSHNAPPNLIAALELLPNKTYHTSADVVRGLREVCGLSL